MDPRGAADPTYGIRQFTVGTGGAAHARASTPLPTSEVRNGNTFGVLKLTLHATSYDWKFLPIAGRHSPIPARRSCTARRLGGHDVSEHPGFGQHRREAAVQGVASTAAAGGR